MKASLPGNQNGQQAVVEMPKLSKLIFPADTYLNSILNAFQVIKD
jgi:hypothetical protein